MNHLFNSVILSGSRPKTSGDTSKTFTNPALVRAGVVRASSMISHTVRHFNALVWNFDCVTLFHFDQASPENILRYMQAAYGAGATLTQEFEKAARELGYFV